MCVCVWFLVCVQGGEDDSGEESAEEEDGFFVPHGYLSEDEGERSGPEGEEEGSFGPEVSPVMFILLSIIEGLGARAI